MRQKAVVRGAAVVMVGTLASRIVGYAREKIIAYQFGRTSHTDAFWSAFGVPDFLYYLVAGGALGAALIPVLTDYLVKEERDEAWRVVVTLANLLICLVAAGVAIIVVFAPALVRIGLPGFRVKPATFDECTLYVRILSPMVFFTSLSALATGALQSFKHFSWPAVAWSTYNLGIIFGAVFLASSLGLVGLCIGVLLGAASMVLVQVPSLAARGFRYRLAMDLRHEGVRRTIRYFVPVMVGLTFTQISMFLLPIIFGSYFEGGVTTLRYANRLVILPLGLFGVAISTAAFPALAEQAALGESAEFKRTFSGSLRAIFMLSVPSCVGLAVLAGPINRLLWQGGEFDARAVEAASFALVYFSLSLFGISGLQVANRAFYSLKDMLTPPVVGAAYVALNFALAALLIRTPLRYAGVALATSLSTTAGLLVMLALLRRKVGPMGGKQILSCLLKTALASAVMGFACYYVSWWLGRMLGAPVTRFALSAPDGGAEQVTSLARVAVQTFGSITAGAAAYYAALKVMRTSELEVVTQQIAKRLRRT